MTCKKHLGNFGFNRLILGDKVEHGILKIHFFLPLNMLLYTWIKCEIYSDKHNEYNKGQFA